MTCALSEVSDQRAVWSEFSLCAQWVAKDPRFLHGDNEDSDQSGHVILLGLLCCVSFMKRKCMYSQLLKKYFELWWICQERIEMFDLVHSKLSTLSMLLVMRQSFVIPAPTGPGNSGAFNFSVFKALLNALHCKDKFMVKSLLKSPAPRRLTIMKNNKWPEPPPGPFE